MAPSMQDAVHDPDAPKKYMIPFLVAMMLLTGVCNTLLTKYQDLQCVANCDAKNPDEIRRFSQPVIQTAQMFVGEMGCWLVVAAQVLVQRIHAMRRGGKTAPLLRSEYMAVDEQDQQEDGVTDRSVDVDEDGTREDEDDEQGAMIRSIGSLEAHHPVAKSLVNLPRIKRRRQLVGWRVILLAAPACCDIAGTTLMNAGLLFVAASIYQMTRGALVLFVGLFSVIFLHRRLALYQWSALFIVVLGVAVVGLAGAIAPNPQAQPREPQPQSLMPRSLLSSSTPTLNPHSTTATPSPVLYTIIGVAMIACAQIFTASQFVLEEWTLERYSIEPLRVVGWEGIFGLGVTILAMIILHAAVGRTPSGRGGPLDARAGWHEMVDNRAIAVTSVLIMISIGGFNFFGLSVTRSVSATARSTIDTCRTLFIWIVSLGLGWESFKVLQILGFALLVYGTFLFNDIVRPPLRACYRGSPAGTGVGAGAASKRHSLLPEEPLEHT